MEYLAIQLPPVLIIASLPSKSFKVFKKEQMVAVAKLQCSVGVLESVEAL